MQCEHFSLNMKNHLDQFGYAQDENGIYVSGKTGYWSNLDQSENVEFLKSVKEKGQPQTVVKEMHPELEEIIFSPKREAGLELLDIKKNDVCVDYGCMWGSLSVGMAKRGGLVYAIDQTYDSLRFLSLRNKLEGIENIWCVQDDIRKLDLKISADIAIVNGVLEWIPEIGTIELKKYYGKKTRKTYPSHEPRKQQQNFLNTVAKNLKPGGKLFLAIENRFDYSQFLGKRDPHSHLLFTSILPRKISNLISRAMLNRPYINYLYSFNQLRSMIKSSGFSKVELYMTFPHYHLPQLILPYENGCKLYKKYENTSNSLKRRLARNLEYVLIKGLKANFLAPSIVVVAVK